MTKDDQNSNKKPKDEISVNSEDSVCLLLDDEQEVNECRSEKDTERDVENRNTINDDEDIMELKNEPNLQIKQENSTESGIVFSFII